MVDKLTTVFGDGASVEARVPPHDLDAEAAVLSASMNDPSAMSKAAGMLRPEQFYSEAHRRIWEACLDLWGKGKTPDIVTVSSWLRDCDRLSQVGGMSYMTTVLNAAPALANLEQYAKIVAEKHQLREFLLRCQGITARIYAGVVDAPAFIDSAEQAIYDVARANTTRPRLATLKPVIASEFKKWQEHQAKVESGQAEMSITGLPTGLERLDRALAGLHDGDLTVIAARPGMGKTALAVQIALHVAGRETVVNAVPAKREAAALFSLEMPKEQIADRAICSGARVDLRKARTGMFSREDWSKLVQSAARLSDTDQFLVDDTPALSLVQIRSMVREAASELRKKDKRLAVVVVDYVQLATGAADAESREREVASITAGLKAMAKEMKLAVIGLSQLNRSVEARTDKRPMLSDLRESGAIEQDSDNVIFVYRDDYYNAESEAKGVAELIIAKQRNGPTGTVSVRFEAEFTRFDNLPDEGEWAGGSHA